MSRVERTAATRNDLLDAARRVFVERGYHGASLDLVAGEAGYTKGAVYSAFGSKGQMFLAVYDRETEERWRQIEAEVAALLAAGEPFDFGAESSRDFFERFQAERAWTLALLEFRLHAARDPELNRRYAEGHRRVLDRLAGLLETAVGASPAAAFDAALSLVALSNGFVLEHLALPGDATRERYVAAGSAVVPALLDPNGR